MNVAMVVLDLVKALADLAAEAVAAYVAGDPSKLRKVQDILPKKNQLKSAQVAALERARTEAALNKP